MAPKKKTRAEHELTPAQQRKADAAKAKAEEEEAVEAERLDAIKADPLLVRHSESTPAMKVSDLFDKVIKRKEFKLRKPESGTGTFDWAALRRAIAERDDKSPVWFMHIRTEDLILDPDGLDGEHVEVAVIAETQEPTLAPMHMVTREARPFSDLEDNTPERIVSLADQKFCWREVRGDDGKVLNIFLLQQRDAPSDAAPARTFSFGSAPPTSAPSLPTVPSAAAPSPATTKEVPTAAPSPAAAAFGSGVVASGASAAASALAQAAKASGAAPTAFGSAAAASAPSFGFGAGGAPARAPSFGFGGAAPAAAAPAAEGLTAKASFGFGAAAPAAAPAGTSAATGTFAGRPVSPKPAEVPQVGFGAKKADAPAASPTAGFAAGFGKQQSAVSGASSAAIPLDSVYWTLWTEARLKEMKKEILAGSRIVIEKFKLPSPVNREVKLQMQNDMHDSIEKTVEFIVRKEFARLSEDMKEVDKWIDDCPVYEEKLATALQKFREHQLNEAIGESSASDAKGYEAVSKAIRQIVTDELTKRVAERKEMLQKEADDVDNIVQLVKKKKVLATKDKFRVLKYYPSNDRLRFRPFGKVGGIHEAGESADVCEPAPYVAKNTFAARVAAKPAK